MTQKLLCVIKSEILVCMCGNTSQGTKTHFPFPSRWLEIFQNSSHNSNLGMLSDVYGNINVDIQGSTLEIGNDFQYPKNARF